MHKHAIGAGNRRHVRIGVCTRFNSMFCLSISRDDMKLGGRTQIDDEKNVLSCLVPRIFNWIVKTRMLQTGEKVWQHKQFD